jgi:hypothetical protein
MLTPDTADTRGVVHRVLVLASMACCALVFASFALFARDQMAGASQHQQNELATKAPLTPPPIALHHTAAQPRRFIDAAAHDLTSPFSSIVPSDSAWVNEGVPTVFALLVYGVGLGYLARFSRGLV